MEVDLRPKAPVVAVDAPNTAQTREVAPEVRLQNRPTTPKRGLTSEGSKIQSRRPSSTSTASRIRGEVRQMRDSKTSAPYAEMQGFRYQRTAEFTDRGDHPKDIWYQPRQIKGGNRNRPRAKARNRKDRPGHRIGIRGVVLTREVCAVLLRKNPTRAASNLTLLNRVSAMTGSRMGTMRSGSRAKCISSPTTVPHRMTPTVHRDGWAESKRSHGR